MNSSIPQEIAEQVSWATKCLQLHLPHLNALYLYGSALDGGLKPNSDIDLLAVVAHPLDEKTRQNLSLDLLKISAPPGDNPKLRALEITVVAQNEVIPWRHPAKREMQFGEWLRKDLISGIFEPPVLDNDLTILLTKVRQSSVILLGPASEELFEPVPAKDFAHALSTTLELWNSPKDWAGDERNVLLTLARIWYSISTGKIAPKDVAASWVLERLPSQYQEVLRHAQEAYLGVRQDDFAGKTEQIKEFVLFAKGSIEKIVKQSK